jgi:N-acyl-D-aspartate/D-glutamate deacylase
MADRGTVRAGARADLVLFDPDEVVDRATYEQPHQFCAGVHAVFVDGVAVVQDGADTGAEPGSTLRRRDGDYVRNGR